MEGIRVMNLNVWKTNTLQWEHVRMWMEHLVGRVWFLDENALFGTQKSPLSTNNEALISWNTTLQHKIYQTREIVPAGVNQSYNNFVFRSTIHHKQQNK